uniref:Uncharacterized protein n=1 Tax=Zea mays TaxID=4577 RepID=A0A804QSN5_MAIZE
MWIDRPVVKETPESFVPLSPPPPPPDRRECHAMDLAARADINIARAHLLLVAHDHSAVQQLSTFHIPVYHARHASHRRDLPTGSEGVCPQTGRFGSTPTTSTTGGPHTSRVHRRPQPPLLKGNRLRWHPFYMLLNPHAAMDPDFELEFEMVGVLRAYKTTWDDGDSAAEAAATDVDLLKRAWLNEKAASDILSFDSPLALRVRE